MISEVGSFSEAKSDLIFGGDFGGYKTFSTRWSGGRVPLPETL